MTTQSNTTDTHTPVNPYCGWDWLRLPALLLIVMGATGLLRLYIEVVAEVLSAFRFPPLWGCLVLLTGGVILLVISMKAGVVRRQHDIGPLAHQKWRSL